LVSSHGEVKLTDFGIAKAQGRQHKTRTGHTKGKLAYMSPEQVRGEALDGRSDLFAVGIVAYELLTGTHPFDSETDLKLLNNILGGAHRPLPEIVPGIPSELAAFVDGLLRTDAAQRPATAAAALAALPSLGNPVSSQRLLAAMVQQYVASRPVSEMRPPTPAGAGQGSSPGRDASGDLSAGDGGTQVLPPSKTPSSRDAYRPRETTRDLPVPEQHRSKGWLIAGLIAGVLALAGAGWALLRGGGEEAATPLAPPAIAKEPAPAEAKAQDETKLGQSAPVAPPADIPPTSPVAPIPELPNDSGDVAQPAPQVFNQGTEIPAHGKRRGKHRRGESGTSDTPEASPDKNAPRTRSGLGVSADEF
jgi:hypothetical protein